ncbi:MAG: NUDIX hydrolase [Fidelibacterota bacterium]
MAPVPRSSLPERPPEDKATPSAVLILLFRKGPGWFFILTERSSQVEHHQRQVSLPGGARETGESSEETALRETEEELGVPRERVSVLGRLTPLLIPVSGFRVYPFVGWSPEELDLTPDPVEVRSVHFASVAQLVNETSIRHEVRTIRGKRVEVPFFQFDTVQVWGATALILGEFREVLMRARQKEISHESQ